MKFYFMVDLKDISDCLKAVKKELLGEFGISANLMQSWTYVTRAVFR